jgi:hypothetical protein
MFALLKNSKISIYLNNKLRGGEVNQRGNDYEQQYACNLICWFAKNNPLNLESVRFSSQKFALIDDLYIDENRNKSYYYQLKTSKKLSWGKSLGSLKWDFFIQYKWCKWNNENNELFLIVSDKEVHNKMDSNKPNSIPNLIVNYFPHKDTISKLILSHKPFRENVSSMCATKNPSTDKLVSIASSIIGAWSTGNRKDISLNDLLLKVRKTNGTYVKYPLTTTQTISPEIRKIFAKIPDFEYYIRDGYLEWGYNSTDTGQLPYHISTKDFLDFEQNIIIVNPTSFAELEPHLN